VAASYIVRDADRTLKRMLTDHPAVMVVGPRASGKSTTARRHAASAVDLAQPSQRGAYAADPDVAIASRVEPLLLDEWQEVPTVLGAVKRSVDAQPRRGQFIIAGSARADIDGTTWPGTGRLVRLRMFGLSQRERQGLTDSPLFIDRIAHHPVFESTSATNDLRDYVRLALAGGFPEPSVYLSGRARDEWFDGYIDQLITRDAVDAEPGRDPVRMRRYLDACALNSAGIVDETTLLQASRIIERRLMRIATCSRDCSSSTSCQRGHRIESSVLG
jgi:uncharacterized protein